MTLLELVTHLRRNILYDIGGTGVDWTALTESSYDSYQLRWSNEELVSNINEAIRQVYRRIDPIYTTYPLNVISGTKDYNLPSYILDISSARRADGRLLEKKSIEDYRIDSFETNTGQLESFIPDQEVNKLRVYPIPVANETVVLHVSRLPTSNLSWSSPSTSPELREEYQIPMLYYAAFLCYIKDEANTIDPGRATLMSSLFDREFPFTSAYSNRRKAKTTNRTIRYGGL